jgi:PAS domain S-box-containing protein
MTKSYWAKVWFLIAATCFVICTTISIIVVVREANALDRLSVRGRERAYTFAVSYAALLHVLQPSSRITRAALNSATKSLKTVDDLQDGLASDSLTHGAISDLLRSARQTRNDPNSVAQLERARSTALAGAERRTSYLIRSATDRARQDLILLLLALSLAIAASGVAWSSSRKIEQKRSREALRESEQRLRVIADSLLIEAAPNAMILVNSRGLMTLVNATAETLFGYSRTELLGQPVEMLIPQQYRAGYEGLREGFFLNPSSRASDLYGLRRDGSEVPIEIGLNPMQSDEGIITFVSIIDVTERNRAERALRRSEERFRLMVSSVRDYAILMLDANGHVESWNEGAERLKGYTAEEIVGHHFSCFYPPEVAASGFPEHELAMAEKDGQFENEGWRVRKDGSRFWANVIITPIYDANGKLDGYSKVTRDITERKQSQEALRESEQRLRAITDSLSDGLIVSTPQGLLVYWNAASRAMFGFDESDKLSMDLVNFIDLFELSTLDGRILQFEEWPMARIIAGEQLHGLELRIRRVGIDQWLSLSFSGAIVKGEEGSPVAFLTFSDITERKRIEEDIRQNSINLELRVRERTAELVIAK